MITLTPDQQERAARLHRECFVADYVPQGENLGPVMTARLEKLMQAGLDAGRPETLVWDDMVQERIRELSEDPAVGQMMRDYWAKAGVNCVCITLALGGVEPMPGETSRLMQHIARWQRRIEVSGYMALVTDVPSAAAAWRAGKVGVMLALQDTVMLPLDVSIVDTLRLLGLTVIQLTYNKRNFIGDGCTERSQGGLSHYGVDFVRRMNRVGMVVDLSHCGTATTMDAIAVSERSVAVTHSFCRHLREHHRAKTDDELRLLAERDGYLGVLAVVQFLSDDPCPSLSLLMDHLDRAVEIMGPQRVGIQTDWGASSPDMPEALREGVSKAFLKLGFQSNQYRTRPGGFHFQEMKHYTDWPAITGAMVSRGYSDDEIRGFLGQNWLDFLHRAHGTKGT